MPAVKIGICQIFLYPKTGKKCKNAFINCIVVRSNGWVVGRLIDDKLNSIFYYIHLMSVITISRT